MSGLRLVSLVFKAGAISNWLAAAPAFFAYDKMVDMMGMSEAPNYPFLVSIWAWMGVIWGVVCWEIGRDPVGKRWMIKYIYLEKGAVALTVFTAYARGEVPLSVPLFSLTTDVLWIALIAAVHWKIVIPMTSNAR